MRVWGFLCAHNVIRPAVDRQRGFLRVRPRRAGGILPVRPAITAGPARRRVRVAAAVRMLAAGVAVLVALCLAWAGTARIMSVPAMPGRPCGAGHGRGQVSAGHAGRHGAAGRGIRRPGPDGIRLVSHVGPGRQDSLARGWAPGASGGIPPGCVPPGAGGQDVAAGPAVRGCKACGEIGGTGGNLGCGDRASLPGRPARYRMIWLVCARCGAETPQLFYDERDLPVCAGSAEEPHGRMELRQ